MIVPVGERGKDGAQKFVVEQSLNPFYTAGFNGSKRDEIKFIKQEREKIKNLADQHSWKLKQHGRQFKMNL